MRDFSRFLKERIPNFAFLEDATRAAVTVRVALAIPTVCLFTACGEGGGAVEVTITEKWMPDYSSTCDFRYTVQNNTKERLKKLEFEFEKGGKTFGRKNNAYDIGAGGSTSDVTDGGRGVGCDEIDSSITIKVLTCDLANADCKDKVVFKKNNQDA